MAIAWKAVYKDGTELLQYDREGVNRYSDIDRSKLVKFVLSNNGKSVLILHLTPNKRLIFRRRVTKTLLAGIEEVVYLVGWQERVGGSNIQNILFLFEDGHVEVMDRFRSDHPWFNDIIFLEEEKI